MIVISQVSKSFGKIQAINRVTLRIQEGSVFGLLGTNGAGKSTLLRMITGVIRPDHGRIMIDGENVWENPKAKQNFFYISDDQFYLSNANAKRMASFYASYYTSFDHSRFSDLLSRLQLDPKRKIQTYSKGMKNQLSIILGICSGAKYLICDETFDGLDPVMRQAIKSLFVKEMEDRGLTPIIASHNLRELEDICDYIGLLHQGGVLLSKDVANLKCTLQKVQCVLPEEEEEDVIKQLDVLQYQRHGKLLTLTVRGELEQIMPVFQAKNPVYLEALPLTLEEIFISETEVVGYDIKKLLL